MSARRRLLALCIAASTLLAARPASGSLIIENRMEAQASLVTGPQFFAFGSGEEMRWEGPEAWTQLDGLVYDADLGGLVIEGTGLATPSALPWWNPAWTVRQCAAPMVDEAPQEAPPLPDVQAGEAPTNDLPTAGSPEGGELPGDPASPDEQPRAPIAEVADGEVVDGEVADGEVADRRRGRKLQTDPDVPVDLPDPNAPGAPDADASAEEIPIEEAPAEPVPDGAGEQDLTEAPPTEAVPTEAVPTEAVPTESVPTEPLPADEPVSENQEEQQPPPVSADGDTPLVEAPAEPDTLIDGAPVDDPLDQAPVVELAVDEPPAPALLPVLERPQLPVAPTVEAIDPTLIVLAIDPEGVDAGDLRIVTAEGVVLPHRLLDDPALAGVLVDASAVDLEATVICGYWGVEDLDALAAVPDRRNDELTAEIIPDGRAEHVVWLDVNDGLSLALVNWEADAFETTLIDRSSVAPAPEATCIRCATELVGSFTAPQDGEYRFELTADDAGELELAPDADPAGLQLVLAAPGTTSPIALVEGQTLALRARSKNLVGNEELTVRWSLVADDPGDEDDADDQDDNDQDDNDQDIADQGENENAVESEPAAEFGGQPRPIEAEFTVRRLAAVETVNSAAPAQRRDLLPTPLAADSCDVCAQAVQGYLVVPADGQYEFAFSSDDEGSLLLATDGVPANAQILATSDAFTAIDEWTLGPALELQAGQVVWYQVRARDAGGPDHVQLGWRLGVDETEPVAFDVPPSTVLSSVEPRTIPTEAFDLGDPEGLPRLEGTFQTVVLDATVEGSDLFGAVEALVDQPEGSSVDWQLSVADDPVGPWTPLTDGDPIDGWRFLRFDGTIGRETAELAPVLEAFVVERDLAELASDATSLSVVAVAGTGSQPLVRVRGGSGSMTTSIEVQAGGALAGLDARVWLDRPDLPQVSIVEGALTQGFGPGVAYDGVAQTIGLDLDQIGDRGGTVRIRWIAAEDEGVITTHDFAFTLTS